MMPKSLMLAPLVKTIPACIEAIEKADLIILGPGSFLTSIIPPLLVRDISNALKDRKGHCIFIENIVAEKSPSAQLSLDEKLNWIEENIGCLPIDSVICQDRSITSNKVPVWFHDLENEKTKHYHDKDKLIKAIETCVEKNNITKRV